ncbi:ribosome assembly factor SBDS, partial [Candidatus Bathyarchaeota archaeon]
MGERYTTARITREGEHFEILVKPQKALDFRLGKKSPISEILVAETIYTDANKGTKPS